MLWFLRLHSGFTKPLRGPSRHRVLSLGLSENFQADTNHFLETVSMHTLANFHSPLENVGPTSDGPAMMKSRPKLAQNYDLED